MVKFTKNQLWVLFLASLIVTASIPVLAAFYLDQSTSITNEAEWQAPNGPNVSIQGTYDFDSDSDWARQNKLYANTSEGNFTATSDGDVNVTIQAEQINDSKWLNLTNLDLKNNELEIDTEDREPFNVSGDTDSFNLSRGYAIDDGNVDFVYEGTSGQTNVTLRGLPTNTLIVAVDQSGGGLAADQTDASGVLELTGMPNSKHVVQLQTTGDADPQLSDPYPKGTQNDFPTTANVTVEDADLPSDNVSVDFYRKPAGGSFSQVGSTQYVTTDGEDAEVTMPQPGRDTYIMRASATDLAGNEENLTWQFKTPKNLTLRNESNASQLVACGGITVQFIFYPEGEDPVIAERECNSGSKVDMTGLPVAQFAVNLKPNSSFYDRTQFIDDIGDNQTAYLLNSTSFPNAKTVEFTVDDRTGNFPPEEASLLIERAVDIDNDGNRSWEQIAGDRLDATGAMQLTGETDTRYRLKVRNPEGDIRIISHYTVTETTTETIVVGRVNWPALAGEGTAFQAEINSSSSLGNTPPVITIAYVDEENKTTNLEYEVVEAGNETNLLDSGSVNGNVSRFYTEVNVTENESNKRWIVRLDYRHGTEDITEERLVGSNSLDISIDQDWMGSFAMVGITLVGLFYGRRTVNLGIVMMYATAGIFMMFQIININVAWYLVSGVIIAGAVLRTELVEP